MRIRLPGKWEVASVSALAAAIVAAVGVSLRLTIEGGEEVERRRQEGHGQILVTWHGRTMVALFHFRRKAVYTMISPSRDGDIQNRLYQKFGWKTIRGSTGRGAARATLECVRKLQGGATLALTPDGPKGPQHVVQAGTLYLARKSGCPIIPAGVSGSPAWRLSSWDRFMVPKPFGKATIVFGEPFHVPPDAGEEDLEQMALQLGDIIDDLERRADCLVGGENVALARV